MGRQRSNIAVQTTGSSLSGTAGTSCTLAANTGWPAASSAGKTGFIAVCEPYTANQETIYVGDRSGNSLTNIVRNFDGNGAFTHADGFVIQHEAIADDFTYPWVASLNGSATGTTGTPINTSVTFPQDCRMVEISGSIELSSGETNGAPITVTIGGTTPSMLNAKRILPFTSGNSGRQSISGWLADPGEGSLTVVASFGTLSASRTVVMALFLKMWV